jgi:hypothetical protein
MSYASQHLPLRSVGCLARPALTRDPSLFRMTWSDPPGYDAYLTRYVCMCMYRYRAGRASIGWLDCGALATQ